MQLHTAVGDAVDHLGGEELDHRDLAHGIFARRVFLPAGVGEPAPGLDVGGHLRQPVSHRLLVRQRSAERLALADVGDGVLERALGHGDRVQPGHQALALEHAHHLVEADTLAAE